MLQEVPCFPRIRSGIWLLVTKHLY
jgi:hypothetical protein